jgi:hypothetical protein
MNRFIDTTLDFVELTGERALATRETAVHTAADKHVDPIKNAVARAFTEARAAYKHGGVDHAVSTLRTSIAEHLPTALLAALTDGGRAAVAALPRRKAAGDNQGHEFHGNQYTQGTGKQLSKEIQDHLATANVYHGTTAEALASIKANGLVPNGGKGADAALKFENNRAASVYVTHSLEDAKIYASYADKSGMTPVVLKIQVPADKTSLFRADESHFGSLRIEERIPTEWIKGVSEAVVGREPKWRELASKSLYYAMVLCASSSRIAANFDLTFNASDPVAAKWAREHAAELATSLSDTTRQAIKDAVARQQETGEDSYDDILDAVGDETRAELIARTESMRAANEGQREAWDQAVEAGLLPDDARKVWIAAGDPCPECEVLDGEEVDLGEDYPGDGGDGPPLHPNCRCTEGVVGF